MADKNYFSPNEVLDIAIQAGINKTNLPATKQFLLGILGGAFIALAAVASNMGAFNLLAKAETFGLGKFVAGLIFPVGLMLVVVAGAELFTGNCLIAAGMFDKKIKLLKMLKNWFFVYIGNLCGALLVVVLTFFMGQFASGNSVLGGVTVKIAYGKVTLSFLQAFCAGVLCNWLVCLGVWMAFAAKDVSGKLFACFFSILLFVTAGFEHSVANMYYIPAGIFAKSVNSFVATSEIPQGALQALNWSNFFLRNLIPVTLGNIVGGGFLVGGIYWLAYAKKEK